MYFDRCPNTPELPHAAIITSALILLTCWLSAGVFVSKDLISNTWQLVLRIADGLCGVLFIGMLTWRKILSYWIVSLINWFLLNLVSKIIYGSLWPNFYDETSDNYCHPSLFLYQFWLLNITLGIIGLIVLLALILGLLIWCSILSLSRKYHS